jgi:hypothetical protein
MVVVFAFAAVHRAMPSTVFVVVVVVVVVGVVVVFVIVAIIGFNGSLITARISIGIGTRRTIVSALSATANISHDRIPESASRRGTSYGTLGIIYDSHLAR